MSRLAQAVQRRAALMHANAVGRPKRRPRPARVVQLEPARFSQAALTAYLGGLLGEVRAIGQAITRIVVPKLPALLEAQARTRLDAAHPLAGKRIAIVGGPRVGKTTLALRAAEAIGLPVTHADDLIELGWSEASTALAAQIAAAAEGGGVFEGVSVVRALRKLLAQTPWGDAPIDVLLVLRDVHEALNPGQLRMQGGHETVLREVLPGLLGRGVQVVYAPAELGLEPVRVRTDADGDRNVEDLFDDVRDEVTGEPVQARVRLLAQSNAIRTSDNTRAELGKQIKRVANIDVLQPETGIADHIDAFVAHQMTLVKGLTEQTLARTHAKVLEGLRQGTRPEALAKQLKTEIGLSQTRATIIANDAIGKLHGELTQVRQTALGIKKYTWLTAGDEKVRPSHRALNHTVQEWAKPPVVNPSTGLHAHPGFDTHYYPCRCSAIPMIADALASLGIEPLVPVNDPTVTPPPPTPIAPPRPLVPPRSPLPAAPPRAPAPPLPAAPPRVPTPLPAPPPTVSAGQASAKRISDLLKQVPAAGSAGKSARDLRQHIENELAARGMSKPRGLVDYTLRFPKTVGGNKHILGGRYGSGKMQIRLDVSERMRGGFEALGRGELPSAAQLDAVQTLVHEEIHGAGPTRTYVRLPAGSTGHLIEETVTEVSARKLTRELANLGDAADLEAGHVLALPRPQHAGGMYPITLYRAYDREIGQVLSALRELTLWDEAKLVEALEAAALQFKASTIELNTHEHFAELLAESVPGLDTEQRALFVLQLQLATL